MKIFKSLNCEFCEAPFAQSANQSRSPRHLKCGKVMCRKCFEREESTKKKERKHQCANGDECFQYRNSDAHFLIDILSHDSLTLSPMDRGYLLCKPFNIPECPICDDEYSNTLEGKSPFCLWCNHIICTSCYEKTRNLNERAHKLWKYEIKCPVCSVISFMKTDKLEEHCQADFHHTLIDFLTELPEMTRQLEGMSINAYRFCMECEREPPIEDMYYCEECEKNICASCVVKKHRFHKLLGILEKEASNISDQLEKLSNKINTYKNLFPELHKELVGDIETFGTKLLSKEENLKQASNYQDSQRKHEKCTKLTTDFEAICEEYMPHLRECDTKVKDLIKSLEVDSNSASF